MHRTRTPFGALSRGLWWSVTAVVGVAGIAGSYLLLGTGNALLLAVLAGGLTVFGGYLLNAQPDHRRDVPPWPLLGALGGATTLALSGLGEEIGAAGVGLGALLAVAGWVVLRTPHEAAAADGSRGQPGTDVAAPPGPAREQLPRDPLPSPAALPALDTPELCRTWRLTYVRLARSISPAETEYLTELRCGCLAELEQRDPVAFGQWFPSARAAGDPARFFCRASHSRAPRDLKK